MVGTELQVLSNLLKLFDRESAPLCPWKGLRLTVRRLSKCHPLHEGGIDEVQETWEAAKEKVR